MTNVQSGVAQRPPASAEPPDHLRRDVGRAVKWVAVEKWIGRALSLVVFAILTRLVPVADFGLVAIATSYIALVGVFVDSGFSKALIQRERISDEDMSTTFWTSMAIGTGLGVLSVAGSSAVAMILGDEQLVPILAALSLSLPLAALAGVPAALLERTLQFRALAIRQILGSIVGAVAAVALAVAGLGVWALVAQTLVTLVVSTIVLWAATEWRPRWTYSLDSLRGIWRFSLSFLGVDLLNAAQMNVDKILIGAFLGPTPLGYYFVGQRALNILTEMVTTILGRVSLTTFSRVQTDRPRVARILTKFTFAAGAVAIPIFGISALLANQLVPVLFGAAWASTSLIYQMLAPSAALNSVTSMDKNVLLATGKNGSALFLAGAQNVLGLAALAVAMPFGIVAVAASRSILAVLMLPLRIAVLRRGVGIDARRYTRQIVTCVLALAPAAALLIALDNSPWADADLALLGYVIPAGLIGVVLYAATLWALCGSDNRKLIAQAAGSLRPRG